MGRELRPVKRYAAEIESPFMIDSIDSAFGLVTSRSCLVGRALMQLLRNQQLQILRNNLTLTELEAESNIRILEKKKLTGPREIPPVLSKLRGNALMKTRILLRLV